jgi:DNA-binding CsgD family transcriptional regulator
MVAPLRLDAFALTSRRPAAIVFITDPERAPVGLQPILRRLYRLTPREAEVTERLLRGQSLEEIRAALGTSIHTTRTQVKRVFAKTGTRSQSDLVRVILRSPAALRTYGDQSPPNPPTSEQITQGAAITAVTGHTTPIPIADPR